MTDQVKLVTVHGTKIPEWLSQYIKDSKNPLTAEQFKKVKKDAKKKSLDIVPELYNLQAQNNKAEVSALFQAFLDEIRKLGFTQVGTLQYRENGITPQVQFTLLPQQILAAAHQQARQAVEQATEEAKQTANDEKSEEK